jgi:hypothetical protein
MNILEPDSCVRALRFLSERRRLDVGPWLRCFLHRSRVSLTTWPMCRRLHPGILLGDVLVLGVSALAVAKAVYQCPRTHEPENAVEEPDAQLCLRVCDP